MPRAAARRVFISYRTSDGADKATALARELGTRIGDADVFLDKDDLSAGGRWRDEIAREVAAKPIVLALLTPNYLGAVDGAGRRRIDAPDDPVRAEWQAAIDAGAHVIPLLADGVESLPPAAELPATFAPLHERTWRRLRAYDWAADVQRLVDDLAALGVRVAKRGTTDAGRRRTIALAAAAGAAALVAVAGGAAWIGRRRADADERVAREAERLAREADTARRETERRAAAAAEARRRDLSGRWRIEIGAPVPAEPGRGPLAMVATWQQEGDRLRLLSDPVDVAGDPRWQNHRDWWTQKTGQALTHIVWRGDGIALGAPEAAGAASGAATGAPREVRIGLYVYPEAGDDWLSKGGLFGNVDADGRRVQGRVWLSGERGERTMTAWREP